MTDFDAGAATGAADYPRKVLDLFDAYVHGALDRRSFLNQCAAHVGGMVSATAVLAALSPDFARGPGIPADVLPYIFNPFFTTKKRGEGSGLGLSICRELIEQFGGKISVETREGEGTTFSIKLLEADLDSAEPKTP